jgi:head-tail adaptor
VDTADAAQCALLIAPYGLLPWRRDRRRHHEGFVMRAGNLDRVIRIERSFIALDLYGVPFTAWTLFATMRAQKLENAVSDREGARGDTTDNIIAFRMRWIDGVTLEHRVSYEGQTFKIMTIKEIGRRVGLDVTCERVGP